jgi:Rieske Fe-S protein
MKDLKEGINEFDKEKLAIIKINSKISVLSTTCTHLGCTVKWNENLQIFECPCHQSVFSKYGKVLRSPAKKDLKQVKYLIKKRKIVVWLKNS